MPSLGNRRRAGRVAGALIGLLREPAIGTTVEWSTDTGRSFTGHSLPEGSIDPGLARWAFIVPLPSPDFTVTATPQGGSSCTEQQVALTPNSPCDTLAPCPPVATTEPPPEPVQPSRPAPAATPVRGTPRLTG